MPVPAPLRSLFLVLAMCAGLMGPWGAQGAGQVAMEVPAPGERAPPVDPDLDRRGDQALSDQAAVVLDAVDRMLAKYPPEPDPPIERRMALFALDAVLHGKYAPARRPVQEFFHRRIRRALAEMRRTSVRSGATVWQMYNDGFVVRTSTATLCFDMVRAAYLSGFRLDDSLMREIVGQCDVLFVSHVHADHADGFVVQDFVNRGKPVVAPAQVGFAEPLYSRITHLDPKPGEVHSVSVRHGRVRLKVVAYPGHQGADIDNDVVLVTTPDGITVAHTGDQWNGGADFAWIDHVREHFHVDVLLVNDWTYDIARLVRGFHPRLVIPGHEDELGHPIGKRDPYWLSFERKAGSSRFGGRAGEGYPQPLVVMAWGESFHYRAGGVAKPGPGDVHVPVSAAPGS